MKTHTILAIAAALGLVATSGYSQGTIAFANTASSLVTTSAGTAVPVTGTSGTYVELLYQPNNGGATPTAPTSLSSLGSWELAMANAGTIGPIAGRFGTYSVTTGTDVAPAGNVFLDVVTWNGGYTTLGAAANGSPTSDGFSAVWTQGTGNGGTISPVSTTASFTGVMLMPIPEPTTMALGGLGAAALLLFRRRK